MSLGISLPHFNNFFGQRFVPWVCLPTSLLTKYHSSVTALTPLFITISATSPLHVTAAAFQAQAAGTMH